MAVISLAVAALLCCSLALSIPERRAGRSTYGLTAPSVFGTSCEATLSLPTRFRHRLSGSPTATPTASPAPSCGVPTLLGSYRLSEGPSGTGQPATQTCIATCAQLFPGYLNYGCSTSPTTMNHQALYSCSGEPGCQALVDTYSNAAFYVAGACSAYVADECVTPSYCTSEECIDWNYCYGYTACTPSHSVTATTTPQCGIPTFLGNYRLSAGPSGTGQPATQTCVATCAQIFPGYPNYGCSTSPTTMNHQALYSCSGEPGCQALVDTYSNAAVYVPGACSAYVADECVTDTYCTSEECISWNYCFGYTACTPSLSPTVTTTPQCGVPTLLGLYRVPAGPTPTSGLAAKTCIDTCALLFSGWPSYGCSTVAGSMTNRAYYSCNGVEGCQVEADTFSGGAMYVPGTCSAFVSDQCVVSSCTDSVCVGQNYCFGYIACSSSTSPTISVTGSVTPTTSRSPTTSGSPSASATVTGSSSTSRTRTVSTTSSSSFSGTSSPSVTPCGALLLGSYAVNEGPSERSQPATVTCVAACAARFPGYAVYACSSSSSRITHMGYYSCYDSPDCEQEPDTYTNGAVFVSGTCSAFVNGACGAMNYCFGYTNAGCNPPTITASAFAGNVDTSMQTPSSSTAPLTISLSACDNGICSQIAGPLSGGLGGGLGGLFALVLLAGGIYACYKQCPGSMPCSRRNQDNQDNQGVPGGQFNFLCFNINHGDAAIGSTEPGKSTASSSDPAKDKPTPTPPRNRSPSRSNGYSGEERTSSPTPSGKSPSLSSGNSSSCSESTPPSKCSGSSSSFV